MTKRFDVVVIGGGAAGLSGAIALARFRRSVLLLDAGEPRNAPADHVHNFLTRDNTPPRELYAKGADELRGYGSRVEPGRVTAVHHDGDEFRVELADRPVRARRVLVASGAWDELPDIPGLAARWGRDVLHCPYCHGWEVRDQRVGVLATSPMAMHPVLLFRQLTEHVTYFVHDPAGAPDEAAQAQLDALGIPVVAGPVAEILTADDRLRGVLTADGDTVELDAVVAAPRVHARVDFLEPLGLTADDFRMGDTLLGTQLETDATGATSVPGVWAAGNVSNAMAQVMTSAAAGLAAAGAINGDLVAENAARAVRRASFEREHGEQAWDERYRGKTHVWSGKPNPTLVAEITDLPPGTALDVGAGEGGDACWLAEQGWTVTGSDFSRAALDRAAAHANERGVKVDWLNLDPVREPVAGTYDLVTSHFLHLPRDQRRTYVERLAGAVAPGGTLLIVGHDPSDADAGVGRPPDFAELAWTADEIADQLGDGWTVLVAEARARDARDHEGKDATVHDAVLRARRDPA